MWHSKFKENKGRVKRRERNKQKGYTQMAKQQRKLNGNYERNAEATDGIFKVFKKTT